MDIFLLSPRGFAANTYLVTQDGKTAVAVDAAQPRVLEEAQKRGLEVKYVLLTHGHFDHIGGCAALRAAGASVGCLSSERDLALSCNLGDRFGVPVPPFGVDLTFEDGDVLELCGLSVSVMGTPGHTAGSVSYLVSPQAPAAGEGEDPVLFTGDTLFAGDVGRTDLPTGSAAALGESLKKLCALEGDLPVYPGHGAPTTLGRERKYNRWIRL